MRMPVYQWDTGDVQEEEIPIPTVGESFTKGEVYRLKNGIMQEKLTMPSMDLVEFMEVYPDAICKKIITSTTPAVYQFESPGHSVAIYLQHHASKT
jgi:hypothetical protein